jgi:stringent starvation protein B
MDDCERPSKRDAFLELLREGWVSLHLDARCPGVVVPAPFSSEAHLVLQYGRNMPIPIADLEVTDAGVSATLSFSRVPHRTYIPWHAVYAVTCTNGCAALYHEDMPADIAVAMPGDANPPDIQARRRGRQLSDDGVSDEAVGLRLVPAAEDDDTMAAPLAIHLHSRRRRPQLRVVK